MVNIEELRKSKRKQEQEEHRCYKCIWSRWSHEEKATCGFGRCFKEVQGKKYTRK